MLGLHTLVVRTSGSSLYVWRLQQSTATGENETSGRSQGMRSAFIMTTASQYSVPSTTAAAAASEIALEVARLLSAVHAPGLQQNASFRDTSVSAIGVEGCKMGEFLIFRVQRTNGHFS